MMVSLRFKVVFWLFEGVCVYVVIDGVVVVGLFVKLQVVQDGVVVGWDCLQCGVFGFEVVQCVVYIVEL